MMDFEAVKERIKRNPITAYEDFFGNGDDLAKLPAHVHETVANYVLLGIPPGNFLTAVFENDLRRSVACADNTSLAQIDAFGLFLVEGAPAMSVGSDEAVNDWIARGGLLSLRPAELVAA